MGLEGREEWDETGRHGRTGLVKGGDDVIRRLAAAAACTNAGGLSCSLHRSFCVTASLARRREALWQERVHIRLAEAIGRVDALEFVH